MTTMHGGDVEGYRRAYGRAPLDFSANVSPLGLPEGVRRAAAQALAAAGEYPDPLCRALSEAIAAHAGAAPAQVLCGAGAADLIYRLAAALRPRRALLTAPAFSEYEAALRAAACAPEFFLLRPEDGFALTERWLDALTPGVELAVLCQPNNPTGRTVPPALLRRALDRCRDCGAVLLMDECFVPLLDEPERCSLLPRLAEYPNLVVLRAFTKTYAMAGLRLGCALCADEGLLGRMRAAGPPWPVSNVAQAAGIAALRETAYVEALRALIARERPRLRAGLERAGMTVLGGEANFLFFRSPDAALGARLRARGVMVRDCADYRGLGPGYYRAAVRTAPENDALLRALNGGIA